MTKPENNIVNLNRVRKRKKRADDNKQASENRANFGRTRTERNNDKEARKKLARHIDGHQGEAD